MHRNVIAVELESLPPFEEIARLSGANWGHDPRWCRAFHKAYGTKITFYGAYENRRLVGFHPIAWLKSRVFEKVAVSLPFLDQAGIAANSNEAECVLFDTVVEEAKKRGLARLELRQMHATPRARHTSLEKVTMTLDLPDDVDVLWSALPSERRNRVRKALKEGLETHVVGSEGILDFYRVWSRNMRDLGSPPHSVSFFRQILGAFGEDSELFITQANGIPIAGAVGVAIQGTCVVPWVSALRSARKLYPNNQLYWECMCRAISRGCNEFDFGRSSVDSGTFHFKKRWGAKPRQLYWHSENLEKGTEQSPKSRSSVMQFAPAIWKRLPVAVSNLIGPRLRKSIPA